MIQNKPSHDCPCGIKHMFRHNRTAVYAILAFLATGGITLQHVKLKPSNKLSFKVATTEGLSGQPPSHKNTTVDASKEGSSSKLTDTANTSIIIGIDNFGAVDFCNADGQKLIGYTFEEVMGRSLVHDFVADDYFKTAVQMVLSKAMSGEGTTNFEFPIIKKDGARLEILLKNATRRTNADGNVAGVLVIGQDITSHAHNRIKEQHKLEFIPNVRNFCSLVRITKEGNVSVVRPARNFGNIDVFQPVFDQFVQRVEYAVAELGPLQMISDSLLFEFSTPDLPNCRGAPLRGNTCEEMLEMTGPEGSSKCCGSDGEHSGRLLPLIGHSRNICCPCSMVLPISKPQMPEPLRDFLQFEDPYSWEEKKRLAVWHGSRTGKNSEVRFYTNYFRHISQQENGTKLSAELRKSSISWWPNDFKDGTLPRDKIVDISMQNRTILEASLDKVPWTDIVKHKYIVAVSGHTWASLLKPALLSRSCVLKQDPIATEWFENRLEEWVHYVPVLYDLSDLLPKMIWAMENDEMCRQIGENGRAFALKHLNEEAVNLFVHKSLSNQLHTYNWNV